MESRGVTPKAWLEAPDLFDLVKAPGPFLSLVLATEAEIDNAAHRNDLRWRELRQELSEQGADEEVLAAVDLLVPDAHLRGQTLVVLAAAGGTAGHVSHWPSLPFRELARWAAVPAFGAVLERRQDWPPYVVVAADRAGADITAVRHEAADLELEASGSERAGSKVHAGGWSERRYQERAENSWEQNAKDVAEQVVRLVHHVDARLVAVSGDVRAVQMLREELPGDVAELVAVVDGSRSDDGSPRVQPLDVQPLLAEIVARDTQSLIDKLAEELGQRDRGCSGVADTIRALAAAQVQVLLVHDDPDDTRTAWFGDEPSVIGARAADLDGLTDHRQEGRLADVLVRAALAGGSGVRMLPAGTDVAEGVGAILRWS